MKGALYSADLITTVSPTYAEELKDPYYGEGLDGVIRHLNHQVIGILNGIDESIYDPKQIRHYLCHMTTRKRKKVA